MARKKPPIEQKPGLPAIGGNEATPAELDVGTEVAKIESQSEIHAAVVLAKKFPRDQEQGKAEILTACDEEAFAEHAFYSFPRGRKYNEKTGEWDVNLVSGPSIRMAREIARAWGNIRYGFIVSQDDDDIRGLMAYAWDLEKNNRMSSSDSFKKLIQKRKPDPRDKKKTVTEWVTADERELRELTFRRASILMRNCILSLIPGWFIDQCVEICKRTASGGDKVDLAERVENMAKAFATLGITVKAIEGYTGKTLQATTREDLAELKGIYRSIIDGMISREEQTDMFGPLGEPKKQPTKTSEPSTPAKTGLSEKDMRPHEKQKPLITERQQKRLFELLAKSDKTGEQLKDYLTNTYGLTGTSGIAQAEYDLVCTWIETPWVIEKKPEQKKAPAKTTKGKGTDGQQINNQVQADSLKEIGGSTKATFREVKQKVLANLSKIKGDKEQLEVIKTLNLKQQEFYG